MGGNKNNPKFATTSHIRATATIIMANGRRGRVQNQTAPTAVHVLSQKLNSQKISMFGAKMVPAPVPRAFVQIPWNSWTYESVVTTTAGAGLSSTVDFGALSQDIKSKLGIAEGASLRIKVQSSQVVHRIQLALPQPCGGFLRD